MNYYSKYLPSALLKVAMYGSREPWTKDKNCLDFFDKAKSGLIDLSYLGIKGEPHGIAVSGVEDEETRLEIILGILERYGF